MKQEEKSNKLRPGNHFSIKFFGLKYSFVATRMKYEISKMNIIKGIIILAYKSVLLSPQNIEMIQLLLVTHCLRQVYPADIIIIIKRMEQRQFTWLEFHFLRLEYVRFETCKMKLCLLKTKWKIIRRDELMG